MRTLCFKEIFPSYEDFKAYTDEFALYESADEFCEALNQQIYFLLYNHYMGCAVAYNTQDEFCAEFGIAYQQYFRQFVAKKKQLEEIYKLTSEDLEILSESLSNYSNNPNYKHSAPFELLDYTSAQTRGRTKAGKLQAYINALRIMPDEQINDLIYKFDYLWLDILDGENIYLY